MKYLLTLLVFSLLTLTLQAQIFQEWTFPDSTTTWSAWSADSLFDSTGAQLPSWTWTADGTAPDLFYWNNRPPIGSDSEGGALVFNSSLLADEFNISPNMGNVTSPVVDCKALVDVHLKFNNYYRNFESDTYVDILADTGVVATIQVNNNVNKNVATGRRDYTVLDISAYADNERIRVRFRFEGSYYFWLIDDVELWEGKPYEDTTPPRYGDSLRVFGIPYKVDSLGGAYRVRETIIGDEIVCSPEMAVQFSDDVTPAERDSIRMEYAATLVDSCMCNKLELWTFGDYFIVGGDTLSASGFSNGIEEKTESGVVEPKIEGAGGNYFVYTQLKDSLPNTPDAINDPPQGGTPNDSLIIAVLDTGLDYFHGGLQDYWLKNLDDYFANTLDDDNSCYADDFGGWNFIDHHNNPSDNHGHGTHVTGIITQNMPDSCGYSILPLKTHNERGVGDIFGASCATYYAIEQNAKIINCSWGYYGLPSNVLFNAMDTARFAEILIVASAGNDTLDVDINKHYPSNYLLDNILAVAAYNDSSADVLLAGFSNYSPAGEVDLAAPGVDISSYAVGTTNGSILNSGTSMAAPSVTASAGLALCSGDTGYLGMIDQVLLCIKTSPDLLGKTSSGHYSDHNENCLTPISEEHEIIGQVEISPNPVHKFLRLHYLGKPIDEVHLSITNVLGQRLYSKQLSTLSDGTVVEIPVEKLAKGWYVLSLQAGNQVESYKFIVVGH